MKKNKMVPIIYSLLFFSSTFLIDTMASNVEPLQFGKDNGLIFRIFATCVISALLMLFLKGNFSIKILLFGFFIGIFSYMITFLISLFTSLLLNGDNSGWDFPLLYYQLTASMIIVILEFIVFFHGLKR